MTLSGDPYVVIGVLNESPNVRVLEPNPDVWIPFQLDPNSTDQGHFFQALGRLKPGVTLAQANARMKLSADEFRRKYPNALQPNQGFGVDPFQEVLVSNVRPTLLVLGGAVSFVLLIACANVANLLLVRATDQEARNRDPGGARRGPGPHHPSAADRKRRAVAGRRRAGARARHRRHPRPAVDQYRRDSPDRGGRVGGRAWIGACSATRSSSRSATGILFGLIPALQGSRADLSTTLKESARPFGHRVPAEQGAVAAGRRRSGAGVGPPGRVGAADPDHARACAPSMPASIRTTC